MTDQIKLRCKEMIELGLNRDVIQKIIIRTMICDPEMVLECFEKAKKELDCREKALMKLKEVKRK